jgi:predicted amino acid-binding ACT domain protein
MTMAKAWVGFLGAIVTALTAALSDDVLNIDDVQQFALTAIPAIATLFSVYQIENRPRQAP